jgi:hypothetical protein
MKLLLYQNRQKTEQHPVRLMEEESARKKNQHYPLVADATMM